MHALSRGLRAEVAERGVRVMTVDVHNVATEFGAGFDPDVLPEALRRWQELALVRADSPLLAPEDVARAIVFQLAQPDPACVPELTVRSRVS